MKGKIVTLRPIKKNDLSVLNNWKNDESLFMYLGGGYQPVSIDQQEKWIESMIDLTGNNRRFMVIDSDGSSVGMVGLYNIHWIHRTCEIGAYIGEESARGKGYASEACSILELYAKEYLNLRKIKLNVVAENLVAQKLWEKLGYKIVGELKEERFIKGYYCDVLIMEKFI